MKLNLILYIVIISTILSSCGKNNKNEENNNTRDSLIEITQKQFESEKMSFGEIQKMQFDDIVKSNGYIISKSSGTAKISTQVPGIVKKIFATKGQKVYKGQILFEITGNDLIELQQNFSETSSQLKRLKSEYERMKSLFEDKIATQKEFIYSESEYKTTLAKYSALKTKLQLIGLNITKIENGGFYSSFFIKAPISGYISQLNLSIGQYIDQQNTMAQIIDINQMQLEIAVFEKDINKLNIGQKIKFKLINNDKILYNATISSIGKIVNTDSKTILCYAKIDDLKTNDFINNSYIEVNISTKTDSVNAVPVDAILQWEQENYLLSFEKENDGKYYFKKIKIEKGRSKNGFVEILNDINCSKIISSGVYNINLN